MKTKDFDWSSNSGMSRLSGIYVKVHNNNIESALKSLKKKISQEGLLKELKKHEYYITGTEKRKIRKMNARRRWLKKKAELDAF